jgi:hypothetical protein
VHGIHRPARRQNGLNRLLMTQSGHSAKLNESSANDPKRTFISGMHYRRCIYPEGILYESIAHDRLVESGWCRVRRK